MSDKVDLNSNEIGKVASYLTNGLSLDAGGVFAARQIASTSLSRTQSFDMTRSERVSAALKYIRRNVFARNPQTDEQRRCYSEAAIKRVKAGEKL